MKERLSAEQFEIRPIEPTNLDDVISIAASLGLSPWSRKDLEDEIGRDDSRCLLACRNEFVEGFIVTRIVPGPTVDRPEAEIYNLGVREESQGIGIGSRLLRHTFETLADAGVSAVWLEVRASNIRAIDLYLSAGFAEADRRPAFYTSPVEDAVVMSLSFES
ncbi:MAG: ribosomal protein S18-alanine N-acetyltransferase [Chloracidobacterium sp.]|nr:ribosomal protein S18-alanine N-acetyltransferase [Chloracidobacterium sp.]